MCIRGAVEQANGVQDRSGVKTHRETAQGSHPLQSNPILDRLKGEVQTNRVAVTRILLERIRRTRSAALVASIAVKVAINLVTKIQQDIIGVCRNQICTGRNDGLWLILILVVVETERRANSRSNGVMKLQAGAERRFISILKPRSIVLRLRTCLSRQWKIARPKHSLESLQHQDWLGLDLPQLNGS